MSGIHILKNIPKVPREVNPEVELGNTCHLIVLPVDFVYVSGRVRILQELEEISLASFFRKAGEKPDWRRVFVVPTENVPVNSPIWGEIQSCYGEIQYHEKVC